MTIVEKRATVKCESIKMVRQDDGSWDAHCLMTTSDPSVQLGEMVIKDAYRPVAEGGRGHFQQKYDEAMTLFMASLVGKSFQEDIKALTRGTSH